MAFWLSRFTTTAQGIVPVVARDQYLLDGQVSVWLDMSKTPGDAQGWALVDTPSAREAWHDPPAVFALGLSLADQVYGYTARALATRLGVRDRVTVLGQGVNARANADVIDLGSTTLQAGDTIGVEASTAGGLNDRPYWVAETDGRYIRVSTTQGGPYVDITSNGTCHVYQTVPVRRAVRWLIRHHPHLWRQPPIQNDGTITVTLGALTDTFAQDDDPVNTIEPWSEFSDPDAPPLQPPG